MNLKQIENEIKKVKDQKNNWKRISYLLNYCQYNEVYSSEFDKYTHWVESLNPKLGLNRSSLIRVKSAGEFFLELKGSTNLSEIEKCSIEDSRVFTDYKTLLNKVDKGVLVITPQKLQGLKSKILSESIKRSDVTDLLTERTQDDEIKDNILKLKKLGKNNKKAQKLLKELEEELLYSFEEEMVA